jgi:hypothetical protein
MYLQTSYDSDIQPLKAREKFLSLVRQTHTFFPLTCVTKSGKACQPRYGCFRETFNELNIPLVTASQVAKEQTNALRHHRRILEYPSSSYLKH